MNIGAGVRAAVALALLVPITVVGCGSPAPPPSDAGVDGGVDAGMDAGVDAGPVVRCQGSSNPCALLSRIASCEATDGCGWTACAGVGACSGIYDQASCEASRCVWQGRASCRGEATACEALDAERCATQPGCWTGSEPPDAGPSDAGPPVTCTVDGGTPGCVAPEPPRLEGCNPTEGIECDGDWSGIDPATGLAFCDPVCAAEECCAPVDGSFSCVARHAGGLCPMPDLFLDPSRTGLVIEQQIFGEDSCSLAEACVGGTRERRLLRFDTFTANIGTADIYLGPAPPLETSRGVFEWSVCHAHHHFRTYASYELLSADACCVAAEGHKQAFCLIDLARHDATLGSDTPSYTCSNQGIQRGWEDGYTSGLDCQWVDITDVPPGDYYLRVRINVAHQLLESDYENNEITVPVHID